MSANHKAQVLEYTKDLHKMIEDGGCRLLVTGGSGLVGSQIKEVIFMQPGMQSYQDRVKLLSSKDGDLTDPNVVNRIFKDFKPTHVIHLAAMVGGLFHNMANNYEFFRNNMLINDNVLQASIDNNVIKVVSCLSTCIFPDKITYPIDETMIHLGPPHDSNFGYSYAKRMIDVQNRAIYEKFGKKYTSVVPCNVYGPHDNYNLEKSHVIPGLIHRFYVAKKEKKPAVVKGTGTPLRQFIHARDLACLMIWTLTCYDEVDPIILSVDEKDEVSIKTVAELIARTVGIEDAITLDTSAADGQFKKTASNDKLRKYLPSYQFIPFEDGISEAVQWFIDNYDSARK